MTIDVGRLREATPGTAERRHFNNAGSGLMSRATVAAVNEQLRREMRLGQMEAAASFDEARLYRAAATLLNAETGEIAIVESHSRGFSCVLGRLALRPGDRVLVTRAEWCGNVLALSDLAMRSGATLEVMPVDADGATDLAAVAATLDERVRVLCVTWCPANGGLINPAAELVALGRQVGALTIVDASQVVGQLPVDVRHLGCDVLTAPGRKFLRGPRGTGLLYVANRALGRLAPSVIDNWSATADADGRPRLRDDARRFENSDMPPSLKAGLLVAIEDALALGLRVIAERITELAGRIRSGIDDMAHVTCHDLGRSHSGLVSLTVRGVSASLVRDTLALKGVTVGANGRAYTPFDMTARNLDEIVRVSPHAYNTEEEIDDLLTQLRSLADLPIELPTSA